MSQAKRLQRMDEGAAAVAIRNGLAELLEDTWDKKRNAMVSAFRKGEATYPLLLGLAAQLAMAQELTEELDRRITRGRQARKEEVEAHGTSDD